VGREVFDLGGEFRRLVGVAAGVVGVGEVGQGQGGGAGAYAGEVFGGVGEQLVGLVEVGGVAGLLGEVGVGVAGDGGQVGGVPAGEPSGYVVGVDGDGQLFGSGDLTAASFGFAQRGVGAGAYAVQDGLHRGVDAFVAVGQA
jgi:hypothetical protein